MRERKRRKTYSGDGAGLAWLHSGGLSTRHLEQMATKESESKLQQSDRTKARRFRKDFYAIRDNG